MKARLFLMAWLLAAPLLALSHALAASPDRLVLGVVPFREADRMIDNLEPIAQALSDALDVPVEGHVSTSFTALVEAIGTGRVDIAFLGPAALTQAVDRYGARVLLASQRDGETTYRAQFNVHADSDIEDFAELRGKTIAFVDPASTSGFQFPYAFLLNRFDIDAEHDMEATFAGSHDAAVLSVYNRDVDVAVSFEDVREVLLDDFPDVMDQVRVLGYTDPIPNDGVVARAGLADELVERVEQALIELTETDEGRAMTEELFRVTGFAPVGSEAYDVVRETMQVFEE